jgi:hypothetical protein
MLTDATRNLRSITSSGPTSAEEELELTRRAQRAVWYVLALIGTVEILFGAWLVRLLTHGAG